jgi:outer membrane receptor protein involved in Fe transport
MQTPNDIKLRGGISACIIFSVMLSSVLADPAKFDIPSQSADGALQQFAKQSGTPVAFNRDALRKVKTNAVLGEMEPQVALQILLSGSDLTVAHDSRGYAVVPSAKANTSGYDKDVVVLDKYSVTDAKPIPFTDNNVDIPRTMNDVQPYYIFNSETIQRSAALNVEDFLKSRLSMNAVYQTNSQTVTGSGNSSSVNLRGLGTAQTLILLDGRRLPSSTLTGFSNQPDLNGIPTSAIDRIEVLPSSASAIYGGSAMGGVINIILKQNYNGGNIRFTYDTPMDTDAPIRNVDFMYGTSFNKGKTRLRFSGSYSDQKVLLQQDRIALVKRGYGRVLQEDPEFFQYSFPEPILGTTPNIQSAVTIPAPPGAPEGDSRGFQPLTFKGTNISLGSSLAHIVPGTATTSQSSFQPGFNYDFAPTRQNFGLLSPLGTVPTSKSFMAGIRQELLPKIMLLTDFTYRSNGSASELIALQTTYGLGIYVPASAPTNPFNQPVYVSFPNAQTQPFTTKYDTSSVSVGAVIDLHGDWKGETDYTWTQNKSNYHQFTYDSTAFNADIASGALNLFVDTLAHPINTPKYDVPIYYRGGSTLNDVAVRANGPVDFSLPAGKASLTFGLEHRKEGSTNATIDYTYPITTAYTFHGTYFGHTASTNSAYAEFQMPLISPRQKVPLFHSLDFQLAGRYENFTVHTGEFANIFYPALIPGGYNYDTSSPDVAATAKYHSTNLTVGLRYSPVKDITLRSSFGTAFLPPTFDQLLPNPVPQVVANSIKDPKTGLTYAGYSTAQNFNQFLQPQTSKNINIGMIYEPRFLKGLRLDVEYYKINQADAISTPTGQFVVDNEARYPNRVTRDANGRITLIDTSYINLFGIQTSGWDLSANYQRQTAFGNFDVYAVATMIKEFKKQIAIDKPSLEYADYVLDGGPLKTKGNVTFTWSRSAWTTSWTTEYFGSYWEYGAPGDPTVYQGGPKVSGYTRYTNAQGGYRTSSFLRHNLMVAYNFGKSQRPGRVANMLLSDWSVASGVKNVFNTLPPFESYSFPYFYNYFGDIRLRDFWISLKKEF